MIDKLGPFIQTYTGGQFHLLNPQPEELEIRTIAKCLSRICRFTGHSRSFYSVAQHSLLVSFMVSEDQAMAGLLHDASEAYVGDMASPLKQVVNGLYKDIENRIHVAIAERYDTEFPHVPEIKFADLKALATERRDLMEDSPDEWWEGLPDPLPDRIVPWPSAYAEREFISRFIELGGSYHD